MFIYSTALNQNPNLIDETLFFQLLISQRELKQKLGISPNLTFIILLPQMRALLLNKTPSLFCVFDAQVRT